MNVFTDYHHGDLYYSLHLLFEKRLGWNLYRPIGLDWFNQGYWEIAKPYKNALNIVNQFLDINNNGWIPYANLNGEHYIKDEIYIVYDPTHKYYHKAITLNKFKEIDIDLIVSTYEPHESPYLFLRNQYKPNAKLLAQIGNTGQKSTYQYVLHSVPYIPIEGQRTQYYHQEIDSNFYSYIPPNPTTKNIFSMVNCFPYANFFNTYKQMLLDVNMKAYGLGCPDGSLLTNDVGIKMKEANIAWHLKPQSGLGHSALGWLASGRPFITTMSDVSHFGGEALKIFEPGVTCLNIEANTTHENCRLIRNILIPENNLFWAERVLKRFNEIINYDEEAKQVENFIKGIF